MHKSFGVKTETNQKSIFEKQVLWGSKQSLPQYCKLNPLHWLLEFFYGKASFLKYIYFTIPYFTAPLCSCIIFWAYIILFEYVHGTPSVKCWSFYLYLVPKHNENKNSLCPKSLLVPIWSTINLHEWFSF